MRELKLTARLKIFLKRRLENLDDASKSCFPAFMNPYHYSLTSLQNGWLFHNKFFDADGLLKSPFKN